MNASAPEGTKVFIAGAPRTGTSILLYAMKEVFDLPGNGESHVMPAFNQMVHGFYTYLQSFRDLDEAVWNSILAKDLSVPEVREHLLGYVRRFYLGRYPTGTWVDKTPSPSGVYALPLAEAAFPGARLIVTRRNGIEAVISHVRKFNASFESACRVWSSAMRGLTDIKPLVANLLVLDQYDFCNRPETVSVEAAAYLGAPQKASELSDFLLNHRVELSSKHDWAKRLTLGDTPWTREERALFLSTCGPLMGAYGYEM